MKAMVMLSGSSSSRFLINLPMKYDAAVCELEGPCMTGPKTSLNMLTFFRIVLIIVQIFSLHILSREFKIACEEKKGEWRREISPLGVGFESHRARLFSKPDLSTIFTLETSEESRSFFHIRLGLNQSNDGIDGKAHLKQTTCIHSHAIEMRAISVWPRA
jgi:hypothetical protein